jgi:hypothetical protein
LKNHSGSGGFFLLFDTQGMSGHSGSGGCFLLFDIQAISGNSGGGGFFLYIAISGLFGYLGRGGMFQYVRCLRNMSPQLFLSLLNTHAFLSVIEHINHNTAVIGGDFLPHGIQCADYTLFDFSIINSNGSELF